MSNIMIAGNAAAIKVWLVVLSDIAKTVLVETALIQGLVQLRIVASGSGSQ